VLKNKDLMSDTPPTSTQVDYSSRKNPRKTKLTEENISNNTSNFTMKKNMVNELPIPFTHTTPINQNGMPLPKIVYAKDLS
jgi:hypothetical protein